MTFKLIKAIGAGTLVYFLIGYLVFEVLLGAFSERHTTNLQGFKKEEGTMLWIVLSCAAYATLLSIVLVAWGSGNTVLQGLLKGALIGTLVACMTNFYWYGSSTFFKSLLPVGVDIAAAAVTVGIMGAAAVWAGK